MKRGKRALRRHPPGQHVPVVDQQRVERGVPVAEPIHSIPEVAEGGDAGTARRVASPWHAPRARRVRAVGTNDANVSDGSGLTHALVRQVGGGVKARPGIRAAAQPSHPSLRRRARASVAKRSASASSAAASSAENVTAAS
jgi:hypothetical protein